MTTIMNTNTTTMTTMNTTTTANIENHPLFLLMEKNLRKLNLELEKSIVTGLRWKEFKNFIRMELQHEEFNSAHEDWEKGQAYPDPAKVMIKIPACFTHRGRRDMWITMTSPAFNSRQAWAMTAAVYKSKDYTPGVINTMLRSDGTVMCWGADRPALKITKEKALSGIQRIAKGASPRILRQLGLSITGWEYETSGFDFDELVKMHEELPIKFMQRIRAVNVKNVTRYMYSVRRRITATLMKNPAWLPIDVLGRVGIKVDLGWNIAPEREGEEVSEQAIINTYRKLLTMIGKGELDGYDEAIDGRWDISLPDDMEVPEIDRRTIESEELEKELEKMDEETAMYWTQFSRTEQLINSTHGASWEDWETQNPDFPTPWGDNFPNRYALNDEDWQYSFERHNR